MSARALGRKPVCGKGRCNPRKSGMNRIFNELKACEM